MLKEVFGYVVDGIDSVFIDDWILKVCNEKYKGVIEEVRIISYYVNYEDKKFFFYLVCFIRIYLKYFSVLFY